VPGGRGVRYQLHPPVLRSFGLKNKIGIPAPVARPAFRTLRAMRHVRGTRADLFGYTQVRRTERRLAQEYEAGVRAVLPGLTAARRADVTELARLPLAIRGYEHIKLAAVQRYEADRARLLARLGQASPAR
jgi:indolepyruvate ferredoxin oxidoreductase